MSSDKSKRGMTAKASRKNGEGIAYAPVSIADETLMAGGAEAGKDLLRNAPPDDIDLIRPRDFGRAVDLQDLD